ncbi:MAG: hypothetical protein ABSG51_08885 [Terracidiphilus sp.]|jgi:hypothetical protein
MPVFDSQTIQLIIIAVAALAVVSQAIVLIAILAGVKKATHSIQAEIKQLRAAVMPVIFDTTDFITRVAPQIEATTADVAEIVQGSKVRIAALDSTVNEILTRLHYQTARVDGMVTDALNTVDRIGGYVTETVAKPARQISGLVAAAKAIVDALNTPTPPPPRG